MLKSNESDDTDSQTVNLGRGFTNDALSKAVYARRGITSEYRKFRELGPDVTLFESPRHMIQDKFVALFLFCEE